jgi:hypothetical protein
LLSVSDAPPITITSLDLARDWPGIERLMNDEEWPFIHADIEASHSQPRAIGKVAHRGEALVGYFLTHHFQDVAYLDMMIVDESVRRTSLAKSLGWETMQALQQQEFRGYVAHSTKDSASVFWFFGYKSGIDFTLMRQEPTVTSKTQQTSSLDALTLTEVDLPDLIRLDRNVFGLDRTPWINVLQTQQSTRFVGLKENGKLVASICLRSRRDGAVCLDACNSKDKHAMLALTQQTLDALSQARVECFARTDSDLHQFLQNKAFHVPDFFQHIGPLVEWRKGDTTNAGTSEHIRCLTWF